MAFSYHKNGLLRTNRSFLLPVLLFVFFLVGGGSVFAGNSGFFFELGVDYHFKPFIEPINERTTLSSLGGHGALGCTFGKWDISIESGYMPRSYKKDTGEVTEYTQIPGVFKIGYSTPSAKGFSLKPEISGGVIFAIPKDTSGNTQDDSVPGTATTLNIDFLVGVGLNLVYTFPKDHVSFFVGGLYNFYIPRESVNDFYGNMQVRAGIIIHPFKSLDEY